MSGELFDVAIIGYGPVGATLANLLGMYGCRTLVLERDSEIFPVPRAVHADAEAIRVLQAAGLMPLIEHSLGTYNNRKYLNAKGEVFFKTNVREAQPYGHREDIYFHQPRLEAGIRAGVERFEQVEVCVGHEVEAIAQDENRVAVTTKTSDDSQHTFQARYAVGCDGARSLIRKQLGVNLTDLGFDQPWLVVDVYLKDGITPEQANLPDGHRQYCNPHQPITFVPVSVGRHYRWEFMMTERHTPKTMTQPETVRELVSLVVDPDHVEIARSVVYTFHALLAEQWRVGRVFLAGDSAHQMPPFAGQGMCSGLRDAHNLSWKLALVLQGKADEALLDTYQIERLPHVGRMTRGTMLLGRLIQTRSQIRAFFRDILFKTILGIPQIFGKLAHFTLRSPDLQAGIIGSTIHKARGTYMIQPLVQGHNGTVTRLDDLMGPNFTILGRNQARPQALKQTNQPTNTIIPAHYFNVVPSNSALTNPTNSDDVVIDSEGNLADWFSQNQADFVIIRPDRYIFGAYKAGDFDQALIELKQALSLK